MAALGPRFCARAFSSCGERGPLFIVVCRPLTIAASLVAEHRLQTRRLSSCGSRAQLLRGTWDLPRPGLEPVSPALAGRLSTTAPPGKPCYAFIYSSGPQPLWHQGPVLWKTVFPQTREGGGTIWSRRWCEWWTHVHTWPLYWASAQSLQFLGDSQQITTNLGS